MTMTILSIISSMGTCFTSPLRMVRGSPSPTSTAAGQTDRRMYVQQGKHTAVKHSQSGRTEVYQQGQHSMHGGEWLRTVLQITHFTYTHVNPCPTPPQPWLQ